MALTKRYLFSRVSGFVPLAMSLTAVCLVALALAIGATHSADEGLFAHLWQVLMAGQVPIVGWFVVRWLPLAPRPGLVVVAAQISAGVVALAPVALLRL